MADNLLYYGDNLDVLRRHVKDETVDLIYLDPPFNSQATYNVLFGEKNGSRSVAQIKAFEDTWQWDAIAAEAYQKIVETGGKVSLAMQAFRTLLGESNMMAYLAMMAPRLVELRRVLKPTGSIYVHCDPTASHYLKMLMDATFEPVNFRNEIIWLRSLAKANTTRALPKNHDVILCYQQTPAAYYNADAMFQPYDEGNLDSKTAGKYRLRDESGRRYQLDNLISPNPDRPNLIYEFLGVTKVWRWTKERMEAAYKAGLVIQPSPGAVPRFKRYLDEQRGRPLGDVWTDIPPINSQAAERLGYPTQKPEALLERIIQASSKPNDLVLDPFCGCGTATVVAQRLDRRWIGIDITSLAIALIKNRLRDTFGDSAIYKVVGEPVSLPDAQNLAEQDPYQFQWWALGLVGARPVEQKKGSDKGIDGWLYFHDEGAGGETKQVVLSVKAGHTNVAHLRDLRGVMEREKAEIGVLITMQEPSQPMRAEAAGAGFYHSPGWNKNYPRLQVLTVAELLEGKGIGMPPRQQVSTTFKKAPRAKDTQGVQLPLE
jgi:DNA modification methylase